MKQFINLIEYLSKTWDKDCIQCYTLKNIFFQIEEKDKYVLWFPVLFERIVEALYF